LSAKIRDSPLAREFFLPQFGQKVRGEKKSGSMSRPPSFGHPTLPFDFDSADYRCFSEQLCEQ
jgi:hypothetical protein